MLWEPDAPDVVLRERFGLADAAAAERWLTQVLAERWGLRVEGCQRVVMSSANALAWVTTASGPVVAKWSVDPDRFARLAQVADLTAWLGTQGLPVSAPVPALDGAAQVSVDGVSLGVQRVVPGALLDVGDLAQVHATGAALARLHLALARYPGSVPAEPQPALRDRVTGWLAVAPAHLTAAAVEALRSLVGVVPDGEPATQLVHGDVRSANVLCDGVEVTALLDLEEVRTDHAVVELARTAVLLGTRFHDWAPVNDGVRAALLAGYASVRPLTPLEAAWWDALVLWQALDMVPPGDDPTGWAASALALAGG